MSNATIDLLLAPDRQNSGGNGWRRPPRAHSGVRRSVQVSTFKGWDDYKQPGWPEIDPVAHRVSPLEVRLIHKQLEVIQRLVAAVALASPVATNSNPLMSCQIAARPPAMDQKPSSRSAFMAILLGVVSADNEVVRSATSSLAG